MQSGPLIAIFCNSFPPERGAASTRIYNLAILLRNAGYSVQVVCAMPNYPTGRIFSTYRNKLVVDETVDGIAVRRVWLYPSNVASASIRGLSMISFVVSLKLFGFGYVRRQRPALIVVSSPPLLMASASAKYFRKKGFKVLLNISDIWPLSANALGAMNRSTVYRRLEQEARNMYQLATAVTAQSNETLRHIADQLKAMPQAMLYRNLPIGVESTGVPAQLSSHVVKIIYPGMLGHAQGVLGLCKAIDFAAIGAELHIYGEGAELEALLTYTLKHPKRGIFLRQPVQQTSLHLALGSYHALLVPLVSPLEGALPSKLFTAAHAGIPVLYSGGGEGEELVSRYNLGFTSRPADYDSIASQIKALASMPIAEQIAWRQAINKTAASAFNKQQQDSAFLHFVDSLITDKK